jgi:hypothetical protein
MKETIDLTGASEIQEPGLMAPETDLELNGVHTAEEDARWKKACDIARIL